VKGDLMSKKTSISHPLQIEAVSTGPNCGRVGITFCPGKHDPGAMTGAWDRDLAIDLDAIRDWGAAAVVTLLEPQEMKLLKVERLGEEVLSRHMEWFHLPIVDVSIPDARFEEEWRSAGERLRSLLRADAMCWSTAVAGLDAPGRSRRASWSSSAWTKGRPSTACAP
jgi:ADP-ribosyl-[dinitrogen reductase] hydrolase